MPEQQRRKRARKEAEAPSSLPAASVRCPYCHDDVDQDALAARCALCQTVHHPTCFDERRGCSVAGCASKVADVVKGWRPAFAPCRVCAHKIYLDENVFLCRSCETPHHPACLEASAGCADCGSGEGVLLHAGAYRESTARARRWSLPFFLASAGSFVALGTLAYVWAAASHRFVASAIFVAAVVVALVFLGLGVLVRGRWQRRARALAQPRPGSAAPTRPKSSLPPADEAAPGSAP